MVIGGGPGGLTAALALRRAGVEVRIYERATDRREAGAALTLWPNAIKALDVLEAGQVVRAAGHPCDGIAMCTWRGDVLDRTSGEVMERRFGGTGVALHRAELRAALTELVGADVVQLGARFVSFRPDGAGGVVVRFADGSEVHADMLIGADGIRSAVRDQLLGPRSLRYAGYPVWRGVARFRLPYSARIGTVSLGPGAQFGLFPMSGERAYWFASVAAPAGTTDAGRAAHSRWGEELLARFGAWHEPIPAVIGATPESDIVASDVHDIDPLSRWSAGPVTVLGDAAHPSAPTLGQGACQAIEDAVVLGACLNSGADTAEALKAYEQQRRRRANTLLVQARQMGRLGQWRNPAACWMRNQMIRRTPSWARLRHLDWMFAFDGDGAMMGKHREAHPDGIGMPGE